MGNYSGAAKTTADNPESKNTDELKYMGDYASAAKTIADNPESKNTDELKYIRNMYKERVDLLQKELSLTNANRTLLIAIFAAVITIVSSLDFSLCLQLKAVVIIFFLSVLAYLLTRMLFSVKGNKSARNDLEEVILQCDMIIIRRSHDESSGDLASENM